MEINTFPNNIWVKKEITWKLENTLNRMKTKTLWDATTEVLRGKFKTILEVKKDLRSITEASTLRNYEKKSKLNTRQAE